MSVEVQLTYAMAKEVGARSLEIEGAHTVGDVLRMTRERFAAVPSRYEELTRVAAVALNGVLIHYKRGEKTPVRDGDTVAFVKAAAGG